MLQGVLQSLFLALKDIIHLNTVFRYILPNGIP